MGMEIAMGTKNRNAAFTAAIALGFCARCSLRSPSAILVLISPAMAEPLTKKQSDALDAYNNSRTQFEQVLRQRRAQIDAKQGLPNLPGQALYLARINVMSAYKDLTDAMPSRSAAPTSSGSRPPISTPTSSR